MKGSAVLGMPRDAIRDLKLASVLPLRRLLRAPAMLRKRDSKASWIVES